MAQQVINIGTAANDGTGDPVRSAFTKSNSNFTELYARPTGGSGTVNSGTLNTLAYYASSGTALSPLTLGTGLSVSGTTLNATGGSGSGTVNSGTTNTLAFYAANGTAVSALTLGTNLSITGTTLNAAGGGGLSSIANNNLLANTSGSSAVPVATTLTALIDSALGSVQGDILYRGASGWAVLAPGTSGNLLQSGGASANPSWVASSAGVTLAVGGTDPVPVASGTAAVGVSTKAAREDHVHPLAAWSRIFDSRTGTNALTITDHSTTYFTNSAAATPTLADPSVDNIEIEFKRWAAGTVVISGKFDGTSGTISMVSASLKESLRLRGVVSDATLGTSWVVI